MKWIYRIIFLLLASTAWGGQLYRPTGDLVQILDGHDNGIIAKAPDGAIWLVTGDGWVGSIKHETAVFRLPPGKNPKIAVDWIFQRGYRGKCYGAKFFNGDLVLLLSDKGSLWEGTQNCRIVNYESGHRSATLQSTLHQRGINWFFVDGGSRALIGCVVALTDHFWAGTTPIPIWEGDVKDISSFKKVSNDIGIKGPATTVSIKLIDDMWAIGLGDYPKGIVYQFTSKWLFGPWDHVNTHVFSPPMSPEWTWTILSGYGLVAGPMSLAFFKTGGKRYLCATGTGSARNDGAWIQEVKLGRTVNMVPIYKLLLLEEL